MEKTAYVRPELTATRLSHPVAALLVVLWLDRFLEESEDGGKISPERAYGLLACYGHLERCRPNLLEEAGQTDALANQRERVRNQLADLAVMALTVLDPDNWLRAATDLANACDDAEDWESLSEMAANLLEDLDDADLVAWVSRSVGVSELTLEEGLDRCRLWLVDNLDRFLPASVLIQGIGQTMRPDLVAVDADLASTADKFVLLLDGLEDAEAILRPRD